MTLSISPPHSNWADQVQCELSTVYHYHLFIFTLSTWQHYHCNVLPWATLGPQMQPVHCTTAWLCILFCRQFEGTFKTHTKKLNGLSSVSLEMLEPLFRSIRWLAHLAPLDKTTEWWWLPLTLYGGDRGKSNNGRCFPTISAGQKDQKNLSA